MRRNMGQLEDMSDELWTTKEQFEALLEYLDVEAVDVINWVNRHWEIRKKSHEEGNE